jgi:hypothetical protein
MKRSRKPCLEGLETRDVPAMLGAHVAGPSVMALALAQQQSKIHPAAAPPVNAPVPPMAPGEGLPYPVEVARTRFHAKFSGHYFNGPPRYTSQSGTLSILADGTSTQFLHGSVQLATIFPAKPGDAITGAAYLQDKNIAGANNFVLDFTIDPTTLDSKGRPTSGIFTQDPNGFSGSLTEFLGSGTVKFRYLRNNAVVSFDGTLFTSGITNILVPSNITRRGS